MSKKLGREGWFRAWIIASGCEINEKNGNIQFVANLEIAEEYDFDSATYVDVTNTEEREITAYLTLYSSKHVDKILFFGDQLKSALDWNGDIKTLNASDYGEIPVLIHVEEEEFEKKKRLKVTRIGHAEDTPGGGSATKAEDADLDAAMAKFAGAQREFMGGDKPKAVPGKAISKPPIPKTPQAPSANKENMAAAGEQAKAEADAMRAEAEWKAMSPTEKKAFNAAKKAAVATAKAAVKVPGRKVTKPPTTAPPVAPVEEVVAEVSVQQELVEALDLSASCTKDEAWNACEANAHPDKVAVLAEVWTSKAKALGYANDTAIDTAKAWPELRNAVLEQIIAADDDDIPY